MMTNCLRAVTIGAYSADGGSNTGWIFTAPPVNDPNAFFFMFEGAMV